MASLSDLTLVALLKRMRRHDPVGWLDDVADAVAEAGGADACDLLALAAERAADLRDRDDPPSPPSSPSSPRPHAP